MKLPSVLAVIVTSALPAAAGEPELRGNVLVWVDAPLYLDASASGASIHLAKLDHGRDRDVGHVVPMHVVGTSGELVEVEPTADSECAWWRVARPDTLASLHLYVKRSDLAPVVTKAFSAAFKDGSRVALQPGVAVVANKVAFGDAIVPVTVPDANLGVAYAPHAVKSIAKPTKHSAMLDEKTDVRLGDATFALGPWVASSADRRGERTLFPIAARCMTATVSAPKDHVHFDISIGATYGGVSGVARGNKLGGDRYYLKKGQKLTSETGDHVVATLAGELDVAKPTGRRACADFVVTREETIVEAPHLPDAAQPDRTMHLCAPADAVVTELQRRGF